MDHDWEILPPLSEADGKRRERLRCKMCEIQASRIGGRLYPLSRSGSGLTSVMVSEALEKGLMEVFPDCESFVEHVVVRVITDE